jgi:hypothetical protein
LMPFPHSTTLMSANNIELLKSLLRSEDLNPCVHRLCHCALGIPRRSLSL